MPAVRRVVRLLALAAIPTPVSAAKPVETTAALVAAVRDGAEGATIEVAAGTFELDAHWS